MKKLIAGVLCVLTILCSSASALDETWTYGLIQELYVDPQDIVFRINTAGPCGGEFFVLRRGNANFQEVFKLFSLAFAKDLTVGIAVVECTAGTRNVISHGSIRK